LPMSKTWGIIDSNTRKGLQGMDEKQLLNAIRLMIREENKPIYEQLDSMDSRFDSMNGRLDRIEEDNRQTRVLVEHLDHNISLVAEQYTDIAKKLESISDVPELRGRVRTLERVVASHTDQINGLKKAQ